MCSHDYCHSYSIWTDIPEIAMGSHHFLSTLSRRPSEKFHAKGSSLLIIPMNLRPSSRRSSYDAVLLALIIRPFRSTCDLKYPNDSLQVLAPSKIGNRTGIWTTNSTSSFQSNHSDWKWNSTDFDSGNLPPFSIYGTDLGNSDLLKPPSHNVLTIIGILPDQLHLVRSYFARFKLHAPNFFPKIWISLEAIGFAFNFQMQLKLFNDNLDKIIRSNQQFNSMFIWWLVALLDRLKLKCAVLCLKLSPRRKDRNKRCLRFQILTKIWRRFRWKINRCWWRWGSSGLEKVKFHGSIERLIGWYKAGSNLIHRRKNVSK